MNVGERIQDQIVALFYLLRRDEKKHCGSKIQYPWVSRVIPPNQEVLRTH
jgi:hypothetical protein